MNSKPTIFLALFFIHPFILLAQISEETRQVYCQNNKEAIIRVEKQIKQLETAQMTLWDRKQIGVVRSDYDDVITFIYKLEKFRTSKTAQDKGTDQEFMIELINHAYDMEPKYTGRETLMDVSPKDFNDKGQLVGTQPLNTIKALRVIRDSIGRKIDRSVKQKPEIDAALKDARYMLSYHQNRMVEYKCDEISPDKTVRVEPEKKDDKKDVKTEEKKDPEPDQKLSVPAEIELTEITDKYGTFTAILKWNNQKNLYEGTYSNGGKDQFQLRTYEGKTFYLVRLRIYTAYSGTINGNKVQGTLTSGAASGTFTATIK